HPACFSHGFGNGKGCCRASVLGSIRLCGASRSRVAKVACIRVAFSQSASIPGSEDALVTACRDNSVACTKLTSNGRSLGTKCVGAHASTIWTNRVRSGSVRLGGGSRRGGSPLTTSVARLSSDFRPRWRIDFSTFSWRALSSAYRKSGRLAKERQRRGRHGLWVLFSATPPGACL